VVVPKELSHDSDTLTVSFNYCETVVYCELIERKDVRTKISKGYQVVVPSDLRRAFNLDVGDEVIWTLDKDKVSARIRKKSMLSNIIGLGKSGTKASAVALKKRIQKGEL